MKPHLPGQNDREVFPQVSHHILDKCWLFSHNRQWAPYGQKHIFLNFFFSYFLRFSQEPCTQMGVNEYFPNHASTVRHAVSYLQSGWLRIPQEILGIGLVALIVFFLVYTSLCLGFISLASPLWFLNPVVLKSSVHRNHWEDLNHPRQGPTPMSVCLGWGPRICISKLPSIDDTAGPGSHFENQNFLPFLMAGFMVPLFPCLLFLEYLSLLTKPEH